MKTCLFTVSIFFIITSCSGDKNKQQPTPILQDKTTDKKVTIRFAGEVGFRRSFADAQFMNDEKEIDQYYERQRKSNPEMYSINYPGNDSLRKRFEELGFVKGEELLLNKFKYRTKSIFQYAHDPGKKINIRFAADTVEGSIKMVAVEWPDSAEISVGFTQELKYAFLDIIPGGNKEIVVLAENYIMLGYNFDLRVYEIKGR